eukprot:CAMPEP_0204350002 /NCGR_PEP_ID=MMETSP0469-20131031/29980_1 /ASSEMBLY_ACC=CAM_ASM_000384 /TAXON_ID=2969 /ORGANISM="Oxyrrhis marina" /LENGTH=54 /DNA_ID=CAMNT_0051336281 /DNA_START=263 /DNA_END=424 /DNA_ORIENTATION=+
MTPPSSSARDACKATKDDVASCQNTPSFSVTQAIRKADPTCAPTFAPAWNRRLT